MDEDSTSITSVKRRKNVIITKVKNGYVIDCDFPTKMIANTLPEALELTRKEFEK